MKSREIIKRNSLDTLSLKYNVPEGYVYLPSSSLICKSDMVKKDSWIKWQEASGMIGKKAGYNTYGSLWHACRKK